jgi:hypothetical protein
VLNSKRPRPIVIEPSRQLGQVQHLLSALPGVQKALARLKHLSADGIKFVHFALSLPEIRAPVQVPP